MEYKVTVSRLALRDLEEIHDFIAQDNESAANAFIIKLLRAAQSLSQFPERGGRIEARPGARFVMVHPYLVVYRIVDDSQRVQILRFWHGSRERSGM